MLPKQTAVEQKRQQLLILASLLCCLITWGFGVPARAQITGGWFPRILGDGTQAAFSESPSSGKLYLPNYSYAGYHWGEEPLPKPQGEVIKVTDYGAAPDDGRDDTRAIQRALRAAHATSGPVIVRFPSGRLILRQLLLIERSHIVIRGTGGGPHGTELYIPVPLKKMKVPSSLFDGYPSLGPNSPSPYSYRGGVIWTRSSANPERLIAELTDGERGQHHFMLKSETPFLRPGDVVRISWYNRGGRNGSLLRHVFGTLKVSIKPKLYKNPNFPIVTQDVTITSVQGRAVTIKEPLLHDVREEWGTTLHTTSLLKEVGIEHLRITFPETTYAGHHQEAGYNGLYLNEIMHSWVRDVTVVNADSGILVRYCKNVTLKDARILGRGGHYTMLVSLSYGVLVKDFKLRAPAIHNPAVATRTALCVYTGGQIYAPRIDQHSGVNHQNLFDDISVPHFRRDGVFFDRSGGGGTAAAAFTTFWNLRITDPKGATKLGQVERAPYARLVGLWGQRSVSFEYGPQAYIEGTNRPGIAIPSLYEYQLKQRVCTAGAPSLALSAPADGAVIEEGKTIALRVSIFKGRDAVENVSFFVNDKKVGVDTEGSDGWSRTWSALTTGLYEIAAVAGGGRAEEVGAVNCRRDAVEIWVGPPKIFVLESNYPNPFQHRTTIPYALREEAHVRLDIYDVLGRRVATPLNEVQEAGHHAARFEARGLSSGVYFYQLIVNSSAEVGKMVVLR